MDVELLLAPQCPNAAAARKVLTASLRRLNLEIPVLERVGNYPSPTILVDGVDVMTAQAGVPLGQACRLDLPTLERVSAALHRRATSSMTVARVEHPEQPIDLANWTSRPSGSPCKRPSACWPPPTGNSRHVEPQEPTRTGTGHMAITVRRERRERRIVVIISGDLDARAVPSFRRALVKALRTRAPILVDLSEATSIHRDGLAMLVVAYRQAERAGTPFLLRTEPSQIGELLAALGIPPEDHDD